MSQFRFLKQRLTNEQVSQSLGDKEMAIILAYGGPGKLNGRRFEGNVVGYFYPGTQIDIESGSASYILLFLPKSLANDIPDVRILHSAAAISEGALVLTDLSEAQSSYIRGALELILDEQGREAPYIYPVLTTLCALIVRLPARDPVPGGSGGCPLVDKAIFIINRDYAKPLTLKKTAALLFVNPSYLSDVFHQRSGCTFSSYLKRVRLFNAKRLLLETNDLITDIASLTGFNSVAHFVSSFHDEFGITPNQCRKERTLDKHPIG